ncbi:hypothetical protein [Burkholderia cepacia]|uniref:hypothetical protein n=1 Tax=Burkholderia cepacia TaxID=292 RepID=UPI001C932653|nr:hypothetical protein [Burkholderia cepacia]MBY4710102.1 hypothetical protein [Burkholderia cepacia]MBY4736668.1 hypothetical protein [Burkholderia cepacia]MBY4747973.1 hypothetical protein [Burkholderia cepacia]MBY4759818.1 hypothetical protein [Burkholderia cepacia]MBY4774879.1 hypothetical protein [Burkholderia cepacia]
MAFVVENMRLKELAIVAEQNRPAFEDLVEFLGSAGYPSLHAFVTDMDETKAQATILQYLRRPLPNGIFVYDGIARPYSPDKAKWLLLGWVLRDAPEQRLRPMVSSMAGSSTVEKQALLLGQVRAYVGKVFPEPQRWEWTAISEVVIDRLEGSRRAIKGTLFEAIVRRHLTQLFKANAAALIVSDVEIRLEGETYDVSITGTKGQILLPVKTRETMGGGHALLFTRDIHKSISVAHGAGFDCLPIIIAESWAGDLSTLQCKDHIYINKNPNQIAEVEPILASELGKRLPAFQSIT